MPFKHQAQSYRNRNGVQFECMDDVCDGAKGDIKNQAKNLVLAYKMNGKKAFYEKGDGYYRVFVEREG